MRNFLQDFVCSSSSVVMLTLLALPTCQAYAQALVAVCVQICITVTVTYMCVRTVRCTAHVYTGSYTPGPYSPFDMSKVSQPSSQTEVDGTTTATATTTATGGAATQYSSSSIDSSNNPDTAQQHQQQQQQLSQDSGAVQQYSLNSCDYSSSLSSTQTLVFPPLSPDAFTDFSRHDPDAIQRNM
jgi:hypothetical protein